MELGQRLQTKYPNTVFTEFYLREIAADQLSVEQNKTSGFNWKWVLGALLALSLLVNLYLLSRQREYKKSHKDHSRSRLTSQEQNIVAEILKDKTNKEIATDLFISHSTVKTHINNLYKKLNVSSREEIKKRFS
jgi:DNA-binding CsgD family transcriptional regulator